MTVGDGCDFPKFAHFFHGIQQRTGVGTHQAVVVKSKVGFDCLHVVIECTIATIVHSKGIAGEEGLGFTVKAEDCVRPV